MDCGTSPILGALPAHLCIEWGEHIQEEAVLGDPQRAHHLWQPTGHWLWAARWVCSGLEDARPRFGRAAWVQGSPWRSVADQWMTNTTDYSYMGLCHRRLSTGGDAYGIERNTCKHTQILHVVSYKNAPPCIMPYDKISMIIL